MDLLQEIVRAEARIRRSIKTTPLEYSLALSRKVGADVFLKMENLQQTGSFKARGALNKILSLSDTERQRGVVAASTGNHGAAVAHAASRMGIRSTVFVPLNASRAKVENMRLLGAEVCFAGEDSLVSEISAREYAAHNGQVYVSPYNDLAVVAGQGTVGVEIQRQLERVDRVFVSLGGGGLVSGMAAYLKAVCPQTKIIACSPANSCVMIESMKAGRILDLESKPTLSDGTAGGVEPDTVTFDLCRALIDECVVVTEEEIADAMRSFLETHHMLFEGSAGVALAAAAKSAPSGRTNNVVVLCGGNISTETLRRILV